MADNIYSCFHYHKKCQEDRQAIEELAPKIMEAASNAAWGNVGDIKYTARTDVPNGGAWCDGATYAKEDYPDVYKLLTDGKLVSVDMTTFDSSVNLNGSCGFFGLDDTGFKVPLLKDVYLKAGQEADEFGAESLPNITGSIRSGLSNLSGEANGTGAFSKAYVSSEKSWAYNTGTQRHITSEFDASLSSSTYKDGAKVNPDHVKYRAYVMLYTAEKELSIVNWTNQLQSKTDAGINQIETKTSDGVSTLNNLANTYSKEIGYLSGATGNIQAQINSKVSSPISGLCTSNASTTSTATNSKPAVVVQNYRNGKNWYRVWSDGWIEQGGMNSKGNTTVNLLKPFQNTNYGILYALDYGTGSPAWNEYTSGKTNNDRTTTSFTTGTRVGNWYAFGY